MSSPRKITLPVPDSRSYEAIEYNHATYLRSGNEFWQIDLSDMDLPVKYELWHTPWSLEKITLMDGFLYTTHQGNLLIYRIP